MVLGEIIKREARRELAEARREAEEAREKALAEGLAEANNAWRAWLQSKEEAEANGQPFDEPPPDHQAITNTP